MVNVGLVGVGFMGWIHYLAYQRSCSAKLKAFCSRDDRKRRGDWKGIQGNFGPPGDQIDVSNLEVFETLDDLLKDESIDVIDICLPPHLHASAEIAAMEHGKDVFIEKPVALSIRECEEIESVSKRTGRMVLVAHVLPYMGAFAYATEVVRSGKYGKVLGGYFKRVISNPDWIPDFYDPGKVGGPLIDLHIHDLHWIQLLFGKPESVQAVGRKVGDVAKYVHVLYQFRDPEVVVASSSGVIDGPSRPFTHGFELHLERATLQHEFAAYSDTMETMPLKVITADGEVLRPELSGGDEVDAFRAEIDEMATSVKSRTPSPKLAFEYASGAVELAIRIQNALK